jgi:hypothetical protein
LVAGVRGHSRSAPPLHSRDVPIGQRAIGSPAIWRLGCGVERVECGVESLLAAPVGLMVGFGGHGPDQLVTVVVGDNEDG